MLPLMHIFKKVGLCVGLVLLNTSARGDTKEQTITRMRLIENSQIGRFTGVTKRLAPKFLSPENVVRSDLINVITGMGGNIGLEGYVNQQRAVMSRVDRVADLGLINVPTLIMVGEDDKITPPELSIEMHREIPLSTLRIFPGCGHLVPLERPIEANRDLTLFLENFDIDIMNQLTL